MKKLTVFCISVVVATAAMIWLPCVWSGLKAIWAHGGPAFTNAFVNDVKAISVDKVVVCAIDAIVAYGIFALVRRVARGRRTNP